MIAETRRVEASRFTVFVALSAGIDEICSDAVGPAHGILRIESGTGAPEIVQAVRPRLIIASADLSAPERTALEAAAVAFGNARIVWLPSDCSPMRIERLVQSVAAVELGQRER
jgi:hypothetical protein